MGEGTAYYDEGGGDDWVGQTSHICWRFGDASVEESTQVPIRCIAICVYDDYCRVLLKGASSYDGENGAATWFVNSPDLTGSISTNNESDGREKCNACGRSMACC